MSRSPEMGTTECEQSEPKRVRMEYSVDHEKG